MKITVYYDENCNMCQFLRHAFSKQKRAHVHVIWAHYETAMVCGLHEYSCGESMKVETEDQRIYQAFFAVRALLGYSKLFWLQPLLYLPGATFLGSKLYSWVARNRYALFGQRSSSL